MATPFVAEIRMFGFNFPPTGWAFCDGQLLPISQNTALFSLLGTNYGGDGKSTFALPNLQGSAAMHAGQGPGLSERFLGEASGEQNVTLLTSEMPVHNHTVNVAAQPANAAAPIANTSVLARTVGGQGYHAVDAGATALDPNAATVAGASLPHNNLMPCLVMNFCIALQGVFPPRQ